MKPEKKYETPLRKALESHQCFVQKLHGNVYQSGLPDLLIQANEGQLGLVEMKGTTKKKEAYSFIDIFEKTSSTQRGTILILAKRRAKVGIVLGSPNGYFLALTPFRTQDTIYPVSLNEAACAIIKWLQGDPHI